MKPSLQLNVSQNLTLTPQLQQAIRLLQLSTLDLQQEIQEALDSNPMLEASSAEEKEEAQDDSERYAFADAPWSKSRSNNKNTSFDELEVNYEQFFKATTTLQDHLRWQLNLSPMSDIDRVIATSIIDATDNNGFLSLSLQDLYASLNSETIPLDIEEIEAVRHRIQRFDPLGCGSLSLSETLSLQLEQFPTSEALILAKNIVHENLVLLGQHNYRQLMKIYQANSKHLDEALQIIKKLNPKPGSLIAPHNTEYIIPDVIVKKTGTTWQAVLNQQALPKLNINHQYASMVQRADNSQDNQFLKNNLQEARWFMKTIESRQETLLKVANAIVSYQSDFLEYGQEAMKPLILNDIALALDMHESTISRVTTQKYMLTSRGVFELKYFFSSQVTTTDGSGCSSTAIHALIKKLIAAENPKKPLSDNKIAKLIDKQGIQVARRTIAKYREALGIAPSNERKTIS